MKKRFYEKAGIAIPVVSVSLSCSDSPAETDLPTSKPRVPFRDTPYRQCLNDYKWHLWVPDYSGTYLTSPDGVELEPRFVEAHSSFVYNDQIYYPATDAFFLMQCGPDRHRRTQKGDVLTCFVGPHRYEFIVLFQTRNGNVIIQNETIFNNEKAWFDKRLATYSDNVSTFMFQTLDDAIQQPLAEFVRNYLAAVLTMSLSNKHNKDNVAQGPRYTPNDTFIIELVDALMARSAGKSVGDVVLAVASLVTFVEVSNPVGQAAKAFRSRLRARMYEPGTLFTMTFSEKLPEVFTNDKQDAAYADVLKVVHWKTGMLRNFFYSKFFPGEVMPPPAILEPLTVLPSTDSVFTPMDVVVYDGEEYSIGSLMEQFNRSVYTVPDREGEVFSDEFVSMVMTFDEKAVNDMTLKHLRLGDTEPAFVEHDLDRMEKYPKMMDLMVWLADTYIGKMSRPDKSCTGVFEKLIRSRPNGPALITGAAEAHEFSFGGSGDEEKAGDIQQDISCRQCEAAVNEPLYCTVLDRGPDSKLVYFCSIPCFEHWDVN